MSDARRRRVVYADDNATYRTRLLRSLVTEPGIEVVAVAVNGQAALDALERHQPDVALIDLRTPGIPGWPSPGTAAPTSRRCPPECCYSPHSPSSRRAACCRPSACAAS